MPTKGHLAVGADRFYVAGRHLAERFVGPAVAWGVAAGSHGKRCVGYGDIGGVLAIWTLSNERTVDFCLSK